MNIPHLDEPSSYAGLYVFDFGDWTAVGYTAEEVETLLESDQYRDGKVYKIHRAAPDGQLELRGVPNSRFHLEEAILFHRGDEISAYRDFEDLKTRSVAQSPPCRSKWHVARLDGEDSNYVCSLIYPSEYTDQISAWLNEINYKGGDLVEAGISQATGYQEAAKTILNQHQLWGAQDRTARPAEELFATVRRAIQR
jgi:hypothetical protein